MYALKKFHVFVEFPDDRIEADALVGNKTTNTLKYANTNFASRLGGHCKRKNPPVTTSEATVVTPSRQSRQT